MFTISPCEINDSQRLDFQGRPHLIAPARFLLDLMHLPLFSTDLASHFLLGLAMARGSDFLILVDDVIQGVLKLVETREHRHDESKRMVQGNGGERYWKLGG